MLAYTALDRFAAYCGSAQSWVMVFTAKLDKLDRLCPFDVLMLDLARTDHARTSTGGRR